MSFNGNTNLKDTNALVKCKKMTVTLGVKNIQVVFIIVKKTEVLADLFNWYYQ